MNEIFKELWNLNAKQTFLLIAFVVELLFLTYAFLVYYYEKNETLKLIAFIRKNIFLSILLLTIPAGLLLLVFILKDTFSLDGWLSFLGGYFGIIGAIGGILWQLTEEKRKTQLGSLKIFNYYFKVILGEYDNSLNSKIQFSEKIDVFYNFFSVWEGVNVTFKSIILSDSQFSILKAEFKNFSSISISHKILEILDYIENTNLLISEIIHNNLEITKKIHKIDEYVVNQCDLNKDIQVLGQWNKIISLFWSIPEEFEKSERKIFNDLKSIQLQTEEFHNFSSIFFKMINTKNEESEKINFYIQASIKYLHSVGRVLYDPGLNIFESEIKKIIPEIEKEIDKLS